MKKYSFLWVSALLPIFLAATAWADFRAGFEAFEKRDYQAALREWRPLAEQGNQRAQAALGLMYYEGGGIEQDYKQAVYWFSKAAEQGHAKAQMVMGLMYALGKGVAQDSVQGLMWLELAVAQGNREADKSRDEVAKRMNPSQIEQARRLAREWKPKKTHAQQVQPLTPPTPPVSSYDKQLAALRARIAETKREYAAAKDLRRKDELLAEFTKLKRQEAAFIKKQSRK